MKINKIFLVSVIISSIIMTSCENFLDPRPEQRQTIDVVSSNPAYAEGLLLRAYKQIPSDHDFTADLASDDAVINKPANSINEIVLGGWTSNSSTFSKWGKSYEMFLYIHKFMEIAPEVKWDWVSNKRDSLFATRLMGEAYALRGFWGFQLLQAHAGVANGKLLGYPIVTNVLSDEDNLQLPRNTYAECVTQIIKDLDSAIVKLPLNWADKAGDADYNETTGARFNNRINGLIAKFIKAKVLLYAASPAFEASGFTWQQAAEAAAAVIVDKGGVTSLNVSDLEFYKTITSKEIIWNAAKVANKSDLETENFAPSLFGNGETNPTQDFVNAFPNADGTPFNVDSSSSINQYNKRDPRLAKYVVYNKSSFKGVVVNLNDDPTNINAPGRSENATLTGYYLKKFIFETVNIDPSKPKVGRELFYTYARYTEALLNFAEAANEAGGPDVAVNGFTARSVVNAIRKRAGITSETYINSLTTKEQLRTIIKNERRIELCFEGHRFWDIRRWKDINVMKSAVKGIVFSSDNNSATVSVVQSRNFENYMLYGPIPYSEKLKYDIIQNDGWQ